MTQKSKNNKESKEEELIRDKTRVGLLRRVIEEEQEQELKEFMEKYGSVSTNLE